MIISKYKNKGADMTKKVIILNGSPRKNFNTAQLLKEAQNGAEMNNTHYSKEKSTLYGLFLPFDKFDELAYLKPFSTDKDVFF